VTVDVAVKMDWRYFESLAGVLWAKRGFQCHQTLPRTTTGTTTTLGQFQFHNFSNGVTGATTQLREFGFTTLSTGKRCTTTTVGTSTFTTCY